MDKIYDVRYSQCRINSNPVEILQVIKMAIEVIINGFLLHRIYGWSIHMFGATLGSLTQYLTVISKESRWRSDRAELCADRRRNCENEARAGAHTPAFRPAFIVRVHRAHVCILGNYGDRVLWIVSISIP